MVFIFLAEDCFVKKGFAKFIALSVLLGIVSGRSVVQAAEFRRFGGESGKHVDYVVKASVDSEICKKETKELKEKNRSLDKRLTKLEKEIKRHKTKDYHGYGFRDGGWWKNVLSKIQAELVWWPLNCLFTMVSTIFIQQVLVKFLLTGDCSHKSLTE